MGHFASSIDSVELVEQAGLPRKVLRALLVGNGLGPASRVLVVGGASIDLIRCLDGLGLLVTGFESSPQQLSDLRRKEPLIDWRGGGSDETAYLPDQSFDLVLVRQHPAYDASLTGAQAWRTTADLLSVLRASGTLAFLDQETLPTAESAGHRAACFANHVRAFPGHARLDAYMDGLPRPRFLRKSPPASGSYWMVQLQIPGSLMSRLAWRRIAEEAIAQSQSACCEAAGSTAAPANRAAA